MVECSIPVELNTGDSRSKLPGNFIKAIARALNAAYSDGARGYILPCATAGSIELNFSGVKVAVPIGDALLRLFDTNDGVYTDTNGHPMCVLGFTAGSDGLPHTSEEFFLGESILRGLYVVYDYENWEIGIASANLESEEDAIEEITTKIPRGSSAPSYLSTRYVTSYTTAAEQSVYATGLNTSAPGGFGSRLFGSSPSPSSIQPQKGTARGEPTNGGIKRSASFWLAGIIMHLMI